MASALVIDDDRQTLYALAELIERHGFTTTTASSFAEARRELRGSRPDVVLLDVCLPDGSGLDLLLEIPRQQRPHVLLMSGEGSVRRAVGQLALRSVQFLQKPLEPTELAEMLRRVRRRCRSAAHSDSKDGRQLLGASPVMQEVSALIEKVSPTDFPVYIEGESGTGKELVAEAIHRGSARAGGSFVAINCGALPETLVDSELFGHERGAFTGATEARRGVFEQAQRGTLFLDEITEMPLEIQVRLLRVLENSRLRRIGGSRDLEVDVRVVAASNRPAEQALAEGRLREDLFHRLCVFPIHLPPLRERGDDIARLAHHFLAEIGAQEGRTKSFDPAALALLARYSWPGNVRQLRNAVQRAYIVSDDVLTVAALPPQLHGRGDAAPPCAAQRHTDRIEVSVGSTIAAAERALIEATLQQHGGDKRAAASALGISLRTLYNRLREYDGGDGCAHPEQG